MPRAKKPWFRFYVETIDDDKLVRHPPAVCWLWTVLMALARKSPVPGRLLITDDTPHTVDTIATKSRLPARQVKAALAEFAKDGMVAFNGHDGYWVLPHFTERQFESDDVTRRTAKHRSNEQRRNVPTPPVGTDPPLLTEFRIQNSEAAAASFDAHDRPEPPAAAALVDQGLAVIVERRLTAANGSVRNPAGYRHSVATALRSDYQVQIDEILSGAVTVADWSPERVADWLEPTILPPVPARLGRNPLGCDNCDAGHIEIEQDGVTRFAKCPVCHPAAKPIPVPERS